MLAERRDLIVATYSSARGTAARLISSVFTGIAGGACCLASVLPHPVVTREMNRIGGTSRTKGTNENRLILTSSKSPLALKMLAKRGGIQNGAFPTGILY